MKRALYAGLGVVVLVAAGLMIYQALQTSLVYFILPYEYALDEAQYAGRRLRLGGVVEAGTVAYDAQALQLTFKVTDSQQSYPVLHSGAPPDLFQENTGVVVEGRFEDGVFVSDELLIKHSEVYRAPEAGEPIDVDALKETLF